jgi:hypothetical protein
MTAPCLYINSKGKPHRKHSYSAGNTWDNCPLAYQLQKILGWKEKDAKGSFAFGHALEESIQFFYEHDGQGAVDDFVRRWSAHKEVSLSYTAVEKDWGTCLKMGIDMLRLLQARASQLPIYMGGRSSWQREYEKEVFPNDPNYGGIFDAGRLDVISYADPDHPALPKVIWKLEYGAYRPVIIDIKTSAVDFPEDYPGMARFDAQLRRYSWQSGIRDVALLWFVKKGLTLKKGYSVSILETVGQFQAGEEAVLAKVEDNHAYIVKNDFMLLEMDKAQGKKGEKIDQAAEAKQRALNWLEQYGVKVGLTAITKQRLQFSAGFVTEKSANEAGQVAARQIIEIVNAHRTGQYPNTFGIRYPHDDRNDSYFRGFVLGDEAFKKQNFTKSDEESFDDLFHGEEQ